MVLGKQAQKLSDPDYLIQAAYKKIAENMDNLPKSFKGAGPAKSALIDEARKFDSADAFIDSKKNPLYH